MVTVNNLIKALLKENLDDVVLLSIDSEGNDYFPADLDFCQGGYLDGEFYVIRELTEDLRRVGYCEDDLPPEGAVNAIALYP